MDEKDWKPWRAMFNKGFHSERMYSLVTSMVEEVQVFATDLRGYAARGEICLLDPLTLRFAIDVIGRTVLNTSLHAQTGYNELADSMLSQVRWHNSNAEVNPFSHFNVVRSFVHWKNTRNMDRYIGAELDRKFQEYRTDPESALSKSVIDLVLQKYLKGYERLPTKLDSNFRAFAIRQIKLFISSQGTTQQEVPSATVSIFSRSTQRYSSQICVRQSATDHRCCQVLKTLREEHGQVLGSDPTAAASLLARDPRTINSLPYTLAVVKEVLQLFSPAGTTRAGKPSVSVTDDAGNMLPTDDAILWILHVEMHTSPNYWVRPTKFLPERWLVPPGHELHPRPGAWRPFELGPRNCVGQSLVLIELRVILACLVREFDVAPAYEDWDRLHPKKGTQVLRGERAYQVEQGAAHPVDGYSCWVKVFGTK
ncbi:hypothetical protein DPSP01_009655 [Paraphaeosphaeria sporulosa]